MGLIFTDAELETDPIIDTGTLCLHCGACARGCRGGAIPDPRDEKARITVDFGEKQIYYGDVPESHCITSTEQEPDYIFVLTEPENGVCRCIYCEAQAK